MRDSYISRSVVGIYHNREIKYERFGGRPGAPGALKSGPAYLHKLDQTELTRTVTANVSYFAPNRGAKYCDEHVCFVFDVPAYLSVRKHISETTRRSGYNNFNARYLWPSLSPPLAAL